MMRMPNCGVGTSRPPCALRTVSPSGQAEDLVSESFLAIYTLVTTSDKGPVDSFRPCLFTVIRNTAMAWQKSNRLVDSDPEIEVIDPDHGPTQLEDRSESAELLAAFQELPDRWQRVLWLSEVEEASRTQIPSNLGIKPNAVSALQCRARKGLQLLSLPSQERLRAHQNSRV